MKDEEILEKYIHRVEKFPSLTPNEEKELFKKAKNGDIEAKNKILKSYLRLVVNIVKYSFSEVDGGYSIIDLISEGNIGLIKAIEKYNPDKGIKFSTYASWWIKQSIKRYIKSNANLIKIPSHINEILRCFFKKLNINKAITLDDKIIAAEEIGEDLEKIEEYLTNYQEWVSITQEDGEKSCLEEVIENQKVIDPLTVSERKEIFGLLLRWLKVLNKKERKVIILRYGLSDEPPMTLEDIGKVLNLTRERIRQIENNAINKLRFYLFDKKSLFI